jgi:5-methylcytosine-specific restriction protein A
MTREKFEEMIDELFLDARNKGLEFKTIKAGDLHEKVGNYPGSDNRMPTCCEVMRQKMKEGDIIVDAPPKGNGASLTIKYKL